MKIDEVSKRSGLSKRTIRYYEEIGIIPETLRSDGGFRLYTIKHIDRLKRITMAKDVLGLSLKELQEFLGLEDELENQRAEYRKVDDPKKRKEKLADILKTADKQITIIDQKIENIHSIKADLLDYKKRASKLMDEITD